MPNSFLSSDLILDIRQIGQVPDTGAAGSQDADLLRWASEGIRSYIFPKLIAEMQGYGVFRTRTQVAGGTSRYRLPPRAAWQKLKNLWLFDGTARREMSRVEEERSSTYGIGLTGLPCEYLIEGNHVVLVPDLVGSFTGQLEFVFYAWPGELVLETAARQILTVSTATKTVTFSTAIPTAWTTASRFDVHSENSGAELKLLNEPVTVATALSSSLTFTNAIDGSGFNTMLLEVGDWVCLTGQAVLPAMPRELYPAVARAAAMQIYEGLGDTEKVRLHGTILDTFLKATLAMMGTRVESQPMTIGSGGLIGRSRRMFYSRRY